MEMMISAGRFVNAKGKHFDVGAAVMEHLNLNPGVLDRNEE